MNVKDIVRLSTRILNLIFWMILAYLTGDLGMGFYYIAFIVFELLIIIFAGGIKQSVARMVAVRKSKGLHYNSKLIFRYGIFYSLITGALIGFALWSLSGTLYRHILGYILPESVLSVLSVYFVIHSLRGCLQGYYQGIGDTLICIVAEVVQAVAQIVLCPILVIRMYGYGMKVSGLLKNPMYANINGTIGAVMAQCIAGIICILVLVIGDRIAGKVFRQEYNSVKGVDNRRNITLSFIKSSALYIVEKITPILTIVVILTIFVKKAYANDVDIKELFTGIGVFAGKYLIVLGFVLAFFFEYSDRECKKIRADFGREENKTVRARISYLIKNSALILIPLSLLVIILAKPIVMIFFDGKMSLGVTLLRQGGIVVLFAGICHMCKSALSAVKLTKFSYLGNLIGFAVAVLTAVGVSGNGSDITMLVLSYTTGYFAEAVFLLFILYMMRFYDPMDIGIRCAKILAAATVFAGVLAILDHFIVMNALFLVLTILIAYGAYVVTLAVIKGITLRDINSLKGTLIYYPIVFVGRIFVDR